MLTAAPWLLLALLAPQTCGLGTALVHVELNLARLVAGREPLAPHPALCATAAARARDVALHGATERHIDSVNERTRSLYRRGYAAHAWSESALIGGGDDPWLEQFREVRAGWYQEAVGGDFEEVGVAVDSWRGRPVVTVLLALPRRSVEWRAARPLADLAAVREEVLAAVNRQRRERDREPLSGNPQLDRAAQSHAEDMLARGYYDHRSPEGSRPIDRARRAGHRATSTVAENIAKGLFSPTEVVERWMNSSGHRRNIVARNVRQLGVGVAFGETPRGFEVLWVQLFADR